MEFINASEGYKSKELPIRPKKTRKHKPIIFILAGSPITYEDNSNQINKLGVIVRVEPSSGWPPGAVTLALAKSVI